MSRSAEALGADFTLDLVAHPVSSKTDANLVFAALLAGIVATFALGNLVLGHAGAVKSSAAVTAISIAIIVAWYGLWSVLSHIVWSLVLVLILLVFLAYDSSGIGIACFWGITFLSGLLVCKHLRVSRRDVPVLLLLGLLTALVIIGTTGYTSFDMVIRLHAGQVQQDTLFHASIASMIKNYGVASTGLNGLVEIQYHTLSHAVVAGISKLSGRGVFETYGIIQAVLFIPLMLASVVSATLGLMTKEKINIPIIICALCALVFFIPMVFGKWAFWNSYFVSESYTLSITVLSLGLLLLFKRDLSIFDLLLVVVISALLAASKSSVGMIYCGLWGLRLIRSRLLCSGRVLAEYGAPFLSVAAVLLVIWPSIGVTPAPVNFLHFISTFSHLGGYIPQAMAQLKFGVPGSLGPLQLMLAALISVAFFLLFHFFPAWVSVIYAARRGWGPFMRSPVAIYSLGAFAGGLFFVLFFELPGGAAYYFSNVSFFVALPAILAWISRWFVTDIGKEIHPAMPLLIIGGVALLVGLTGASKLHLSNSTAHASSVKNPLIERLTSIREKASKELVVEAGEDMARLNPIAECAARPFVFPAVSERPWVGIIKIGDGCAYQHYGYPDYNVAPGQFGALPAPQLRGLPLVSEGKALQSGRPGN